jgi:hypothetical protein
VSVTNGYATLAQVKQAARMSTVLTDDDSLVEMSIETASRMIDGYCERRFWTNGTETRTYATLDPRVLRVDDIAGTAITLKTSSSVDGIYDITWAASDFDTEPYNRISAGLASPVTSLRAVGDYAFTRSAEPCAEVTAVFGFGTAVPTQVTHATVLLALRQFKRYDSPTGIIGFGDMGAIRVSSRMDPDVAAILQPFRRAPIGLA